MLKEKVDAAQKKEVMLKACLKPLFNEAYLIMTTIEGKMASLQESQQKINLDIRGAAIEQVIEEMKQAETQCTTEVSVVQVELGGLHDKIFAPSE